MEEEFRVLVRRDRRRVIMGLVAFYALAVPAYLYLGFQPSGNTVLAYAEEAKTATGGLAIPSIGLAAPVSDVELNGRVLSAPNYIVGRYQSYDNKVLVMGHSSTVFQKLSEVSVGDEIFYDGQSFKVVSREIKAKSEILMREILKDEKEPTIVLMTCSGEHISGQDYSHRLIVNAVMNDGRGSV